MTIPNPDHFLEQAARLAAGRPRQADLRRAISTAYYSLFHLCLIAAADEFVGVTHRGTSRYALVYRGIDHRVLKDLCTEIAKSRPSSRYARYFPSGGFNPNLRAFAGTALELQEKRHEADYDPQSRFNARDALVDIVAARTAIAQFRTAPEDHRRLFLTLLFSPPR